MGGNLRHLADLRSHWQDKYRTWPQAFEKISYVDLVMEEIAGGEPLSKAKKYDGAYQTIEETATEWWGLNGEILDQELQEYLKDMNELFIKLAEEEGGLACMEIDLRNMQDS